MLARAALPLLLCLLGCTTLRDDMRRAERAFADARYENVEVWLTALEPDVAAMPPDLRARFYYLAGMSSHRLGKDGRARHWLALCREELDSHALQLPSNWQQNLEATLPQL